MSADDIARLSLTEVARLIRKRKISSVEATEASVGRLERYGARFNCVVEIDAEGALKAARKADRELARRQARGPLHGVPLAHKDMYYRKGRVSGCGSRIRASFVPDHTATVLQRLDAAGALDIARLNMVEFALGITGHNEITGDVRNPWNPKHLPGGSSSGSAVSVAARLTYGSLGSDTGGSIRFPASCCGIVGIKPTYSRVSRFGAMPLSFSCDTVGPLTRTVADAALILQVLAGRDANDPTSSARSVPNYSAGIGKSIRGLKIGVPETYFYEGIDAAVEKPVRESLDVLRRLGAKLLPVAMPAAIGATNTLTSMIIVAEAAAIHSRWLRDRPDDYGTQTRGRMLMGLFCPATRYLEALNLRGRLLAGFVESVFRKCDVLHTPVLPVEVPTLAETDLKANPGFLKYVGRMGHCTRPVNYLGLPAITVPCGFTQNGLPTGFQMVGRPFDEATLFRAASAYERATDWHTREPAL
ncbi:MAG: amidase [Rhodospirillales bacterium]|nr:amidase [Rhodospirillales bacterium]